MNKFKKCPNVWVSRMRRGVRKKARLSSLKQNTAKRLNVRFTT